jgi:hypothetical protein
MKTSIALIFICIYTASFSQESAIKWQQCYGTPDWNMTHAIEKTATGYLLGAEVRIDDPGITNYHGTYDIWIVNIDSIGSIIWEKCYGGSDGETIEKIIKKSDDEIFLFGYTFSTDGDVQSYNHGESDLWVVKINGIGDTLFEKCYGSPGPDDPRDMILTPDGGFVLLCRIAASGGDVTQYYGSWDNWMCKCDSLGNIEWEKTIGNEWLDSGMQMLINSEGHIMMIGAAAHYGGIVDCDAEDYMGDVWLVELDMEGNVLWQRCYGGSSYELGYVIRELEDGYIFAVSCYSADGDVTGHHGPGGDPPVGKSDIWVVRINDQGDITWQKSLGGYDYETPYFIDQVSDGGFIVIGTTNSNDGDVSGNHALPESGYHDIWMVKLGNAGDLEWQKCIGGMGDERFESVHSVVKKGDYNYVIAAETNYKSGNDDIQCDIHANGDYDAWVFEIDTLDTTDVIETLNINNAMRVYPNPAKEYVVFECKGLQAKQQKQFSIQIVTVLGQVIETLEIKGDKTVWVTEGVMQGVYLYKIEGGGYFGKVVVADF